MTRSSFKQFSLKELDGWINLESSPNEIANKQCVKSVNFNYSWNKLISAKEAWLYNSTWRTINAIADIDNEVYYASWSDIYKNTEIINTNSYAYLLNEIIVWDTYTITINWNNYSYTAQVWDGLGEVIDYLFDLVKAAGFKAEKWFVLHTDYKEYAAVLVFWNISSFSGTNWITKNSETITGITDWQINRNWLDIIYTGNWKWYYLQKILDGNDVAYLTQKIKFREYSPKFAITYWGKLFYATWDSNIIYFSKTAWLDTPYYVVDFWRDDRLYDAWLQMVWWDSKITWLATWENGIYVFKEHEVYYSNSVNDDWVWFSFVFNKITNNWAVNNDAIISAWQEMFFFWWNNKELRRLTYEQYSQSLRDSAISSPISSITKDYSNVKIGYQYPNAYIFEDNKDTIVYNVDRKSFAIEDTGNIWKIAWQFYSIWTDIYKLLNWDYYSSWEWIGKELDLWDAIDIKRFSQIEIYWKMPEDNFNLYVDIYIDKTLIETFQVENNFGSFFRRRYDLYDEWRYIQIWIRYEWVWELEINELNFKSKPIKWYKYN